MRPDPARLPVRPSTNDIAPMLLGPQRYAVVRVLSLDVLRVSGILCSALLLACCQRRVQNAWDAFDRLRGVNYPTLLLADAHQPKQPLASRSVLRCVFCILLCLPLAGIGASHRRPATPTTRHSVTVKASLT